MAREEHGRDALVSMIVNARLEGGIDNQGAMETRRYSDNRFVWSLIANVRGRGLKMDLFGNRKTSSTMLPKLLSLRLVEPSTTVFLIQYSPTSLQNARL